MCFAAWVWGTEEIKWKNLRDPVLWEREIKQSDVCRYKYLKWVYGWVWAINFFCSQMDKLVNNTSIYHNPVLTDWALPGRPHMEGIMFNMQYTDLKIFIVAWDFWCSTVIINTSKSQYQCNLHSANRKYRNGNNSSITTPVCDTCCWSL